MDTSTGTLYPSPDAALGAGVKPEDLVEVKGPEKAVLHLAVAAAQALADKRERQVQSAIRFLSACQDGVVRADREVDRKREQLLEATKALDEAKTAEKRSST